MLQMILPEGSSSLLAFFGILFAFGATVLATAKLSPYLPKDAGWCGRTLRNPVDHYDHVHLYRGPYEGRQ